MVRGGVVFRLFTERCIEGGGRLWRFSEHGGNRVDYVVKIFNVFMNPPHIVG